jgi:hypothetical protein
MTNRRIPTRVVETGRVVRGSSGQGVGWLQSLQDRVTNLKAQIYGVRERLNSPFRDGVPVSVQGELLFKADTSRIISIPNFPTNQEAGTFIALNCNPIILSGVTYRVPIMLPPPGVFQAHNLVVDIEAGFLEFNGQQRPGIFPLNDYRQTSLLGDWGAQPSTGPLTFTLKQQVLGTFATALPYLPFFWNLVDEKSGRQYSESLIPSGALLNTRGQSQLNRVSPDSELFEFDAPWLFERDAQLAFHFRPIMDLYQIDAASATLPWGTADKNQGRRNNQATLRVELHGVRFYDEQDVLKDGAQL